MWQNLVNEKFLIIAITLVCIIFGTLYAFYKTPIYSASVSVQVQQIQYPFSSNSLSSPYVSIEKENTTADVISKMAGVAVTVPKNLTGILNLSKESPDPKKARLEVERAVELIKSRYQQIYDALRPFGVKEVMPVALIGDVIVSDKPVKPKKTLIIAVATVLGLILGIFVALIRQAVKKRRESGLA